MKEIDHESDPLYLLTKAVEEGDPKVAKKVKELLDKSIHPTSKMIQMNIGKKMITLRSKSK